MNYYTALRFSNKPELHMTLRYFANLLPVDVARLIQDMNHAMQQPFPIGALWCRLTKEEMFGANRTTRVLVPEDPIPWMPWLQQLLQLPDSEHFRSVCPGWRPHVTCQDASLDLIISGVAIMKKKEVFVEWRIK